MFERTIWWGADGQSIEVIDQTKLPHEATVAIWRTLDDAVEGIRSMEVRGAPLIGVAAAHGVALAISEDPNSLDEACEALASTRPTAVNLAWALRQCRERLAAVSAQDRGVAARQFATELAEADVAACRRIGEFGVDLIASIHERTGKPVEVLTHCNAGFLATVEWGTATAPVYVGHERGIPLHVWVSETRPRNQGAALTTWELGLHGVPHTLIVDNAAGHLLQHGNVDIVITGADRVASNGDSANKIGTYLKALAARAAGVPFHIAAPASTFDAGCSSGADIPIEERSGDEVLVVNGELVAPAGTPVANWGFDVTPAGLITSWITDRGVLRADQLGTVLDG